jgi:hypothetical protein
MVDTDTPMIDKPQHRMIMKARYFIRLCMIDIIDIVLWRFGLGIPRIITIIVSTDNTHRIITNSFNTLLALTSTPCMSKEKTSVNMPTGTNIRIRTIHTISLISAGLLLFIDIPPCIFLDNILS